MSSAPTTHGPFQVQSADECVERARGLDHQWKLFYWS
jgi:hypothetical protein